MVSTFIKTGQNKADIKIFLKGGLSLKRISALALVLIFFVLFTLACTPQDNVPEEPQENNQEQGATDTEEPNDAQTTASIVNEETAFKKAISKEGTWIICTLNDLSFDEDLIVEGEFRDKDDEDNDLYRKIALYAQDEDRNVTDRYTLTAPKMIIRSPNTNIVNGTFKGDIYVEAEGFTVSGAVIDGNVYFASEEYESTFEMANEGEVTGDIEVRDQGDTEGEAEGGTENIE